MPLHVGPHTAAADAHLHQHHHAHQSAAAAAAVPSAPQHAAVGDLHLDGGGGGDQQHPHAAVRIDAAVVNKDPQAAAGVAGTAAPGSEQGGTPSARPPRPPLKARLAAFAVNNFMLLSFSVAAAAAMAWPLPGKVVASWAVGDIRVVQAINNFLVFLISGLTLKSDDFRCVCCCGRCVVRWVWCGVWGLLPVEERPGRQGAGCVSQQEQRQVCDGPVSATTNRQL
jgi:hypothetical protein